MACPRRESGEPRGAPVGAISAQGTNRTRSLASRARAPNWAGNLRRGPRALPLRDLFFRSDSRARISSDAQRASAPRRAPPPRASRRDRTPPRPSGGRGPQRSKFARTKTATVGAPEATARCIGPASGVSTARQAASSAPTLAEIRLVEVVRGAEGSADLRLARQLLGAEEDEQRDLLRAQPGGDARERLERPRLALARPAADEERDRRARRDAERPPGAARRTACSSGREGEAPLAARLDAEGREEREELVDLVDRRRARSTALEKNTLPSGGARRSGAARRAGDEQRAEGAGRRREMDRRVVAAAAQRADQAEQAPRLPRRRSAPRRARVASARPASTAGASGPPTKSSSASGSAFASARDGRGRRAGCCRGAG